MPRTKQSFEEWMEKVNKILVRKTGMYSNDLMDVDYYRMYKDGTSPSAAASRAIKYNMEN